MILRNARSNDKDKNINLYLAWGRNVFVKCKYKFKIFFRLTLRSEGLNCVAIVVQIQAVFFFKHYSSKNMEGDIWSHVHKFTIDHSCSKMSLHPQ